MADDKGALNKEGVQTERYLTFTINGEAFGIKTEDVTEIIGVQPITKMPRMPDYIKGVINLRGKVVPVIDMRLKFLQEAVEYNDRTCVIVVDRDDIIVGLIVDDVTEVVNIKTSDIVLLPENRAQSSVEQYTAGIGRVAGEIKLLLDCDKLFEENIYASDN